MDGRCDVPHGDYIVVRGGRWVAVNLEVTQNPVNGLNRSISIEEGESSSEALNKSKTSNKSLCDRICDLWLIRKVVDLFRILLTCSGRNVESASGNAGGSVDVAACTAMADLLADNVRLLGKTIELQSPPFNQWMKAALRYQELDVELVRLEKNIFALKSCQPDPASEEIAYLVVQKDKTERRLDWIRFYIENNQRCDYYNCNVHYCDVVSGWLYGAARKTLEGNDSLLDELEGFYRSSKCFVEKTIKNGRASLAIDAMEESRDTALRLVDSINQRDRYQQELDKQVSTGMA